MNSPPLGQRHLTVRVPIEMYRRLDEIAKAEHRTVSQEIRRMMERRIHEHDKEELAA